jgi:hypothetical protein
VRFNDYLMQHEQQQRLEDALSAADPVSICARQQLHAGYRVCGVCFRPLLSFGVMLVC